MSLAKNLWISAVTLVSSFSCYSAMAQDNNDGQAGGTPAAATSHTARTPCPFINALIRGGEIGKEETTVEALVTAAAKFGVNKNLMWLLAKSRAEKGSSRILLSKLLDPNLAPAHLGSLARGDGDRSVVETERLEQLLTSPQFSSEGRISYKQLQEYQEYCWHMSPMGLKDRTFSNAEVQLLWGLFGAYREKNVDNEDTLPLQLVYNFLKDNSLPENFQVNNVDPVTIGRLALSLIWNSYRR